MSVTPNRFDPNTSIEDNLALLNQNFDALDDQDRTKIIRNGLTPAILFGYQKGGFGGQDYGLKIAKPGFDVTTANSDQMIFNSGLDHLKVVYTGTLTATLPTHTGGQSFTATYTHGLGFVPASIGYISYAGTYYALPYYGTAYNGTTGNFEINIMFSMYTDATNAYFTIYGGSTQIFNGTYSCKFYLLQETAN